MTGPCHMHRDFMVFLAVLVCALVGALDILRFCWRCLP